MFQAIQFCRTVQLSVSVVFVYTQLNVKTVLFQTIQFSISTHFSSIWPIDRTLSGTNTPRLCRLFNAKSISLDFRVTFIYLCHYYAD